jgi:hypothetical protein
MKDTIVAVAGRAELVAEGHDMLDGLLRMCSSPEAAPAKPLHEDSADAGHCLVLELEDGSSLVWRDPRHPTAETLTDLGRFPVLRWRRGCQHLLQVRLPHSALRRLIGAETHADLPGLVAGIIAVGYAGTRGAGPVDTTAGTALHGHLSPNVLNRYAVWPHPWSPARLVYRDKGLDPKPRLLPDPEWWPAFAASLTPHLGWIVDRDSATGRMSIAIAHHTASPTHDEDPVRVLRAMATHPGGPA